jgi:hypothetical protein
MPMIIYYTKLHLSKCNGSQVVSAKQNIKFNFQPHTTFLFLGFHFIKTILLNVVHPLNIFWHTKFHAPRLTGASFASTSKTRMSAILEWLSYGT